MKLKVDPERLEDHLAREYGESRIFVPAEGPDGKQGSFDIIDLDKESLLKWLKSRGGDNPWAEDTIGILLGHGYLHVS